MVPKSYDNLPEGFVERMFYAITASEIRAPTSRDPRKLPFDYECYNGEIQHRLISAKELDE